MIYTVIETQVNFDEPKPEKIITNFEDNYILKAKADAEAFYIERYLNGGYTELRFMLKSDFEMKLLSEDQKQENTKIEATRLTELIGLVFETENWDNRLHRLIKAYKN